MSAFRPHRFTLNAFDDGSGVWLCEWLDDNTYREHGWDPKDGYKLWRAKSGCADVHTDIPFNQSGGITVPRRLAKSIVKSWKMGNAWDKKEVQHDRSK